MKGKLPFAVKLRAKVPINSMEKREVSIPILTGGVTAYRILNLVQQVLQSGKHRSLL